MAAQIEVVSTKPMTKGSLKMFATVRLGGITVHGFRVIQQEGQRAWVAPPQTEVAQTDGKKKYFPIVELADNIKEVVSKLILEEYEKISKTSTPAPDRYLPTDDDITF